MSFLSSCRNVFNTKINPTLIYFGNCRAKMHLMNCSKLIHSTRNRSAAPLILRRNFFKIFRRPKKSELKALDNVPDQYALIYRNTMDRYILFAQIITTVSAAIVIFFTVLRYDYTKYKVGIDENAQDMVQRQSENERYIYLSAFILFVVILQLLVYKLPIRIYYLSQQKKYVLVFYGNYPFTTRKITCSVGDVLKLPEKGISPWKDAKYHIKDQQDVILLEQHFRRSADLYVMMGVQRDPDHEEEQ